ncbi:hypothetical protein [Paraburkholderia fungorum]|uniref:hypothetical protein n=1 Tax=Paraburkholderia fungorum TaxID=134537 RepID=UPI0038BD068C
MSDAEMPRAQVRVQHRHAGLTAALSGPFTLAERFALLVGGAVAATLGIVVIWSTTDARATVPLVLLGYALYVASVLLVSRRLAAFRQVDVVNVAACVAGFTGLVYALHAGMQLLGLASLLIPVLCVALNIVRSKGIQQ